MSEAAFTTPVRRMMRSPICLNDTLSASPMIIPASPFMKKLGWGTCVSVYLYERSPTSEGYGRSPWAIKKIMPERQKINSINMEGRLKKEADILKILNHTNIVGFRAYSKDKSGLPFLVMENCEKSLNDLIEARSDANKGPFPAKHIFKVAVSVLSALKYLHAEQKMLHGDLKSTNVLILGDFDSVKLCDFGVSLQLKDDLSGLKDIDECYVGTTPWNCKESFTDGPITDKADIYAFGLTLWEMISLEIPHTNGLDSEASYDESLDEEMFYSLLGTRPPLPDYDFDHEYQPLLELFSTCTDENPVLRPSATLALDALQSISMI